MMRGAVVSSSNEIVFYEGANSDALDGADIGTTFWFHGSVTYQAT